MDLTAGLEITSHNIFAAVVDAKREVLLSRYTFPLEPETLSEKLTASLASAVRLLRSRHPDLSSFAVCTNLIAESFLRPPELRVGLVLIGYNQPYNCTNIPEALPATHIRHVCGGHKASGIPIESLGREAVKNAAHELQPFVDCFALSSYTGVVNGDHEQEAKRILEALGAGQVWCGSTVTDEYHAARRATGAVLSAHAFETVRALVDGMDPCSKACIDGATEVVFPETVYIDNTGTPMDADRLLSRPLTALVSTDVCRVSAALLPGTKGAAIILNVQQYCIGCTVIEGGKFTFASPLTYPGQLEIPEEGVPLLHIPIGLHTRVRKKEGPNTNRGEFVLPYGKARVRYPRVREKLDQAGWNETGKLLIDDALYFIVGERRRYCTPVQYELLAVLKEGPRCLTEIASLLLEEEDLIEAELAALYENGTIEITSLSLWDLLTAGGAEAERLLKREASRAAQLLTAAYETERPFSGERDTVFVTTGGPSIKRFERLIAEELAVPMWEQPYGPWAGAVGAALCKERRNAEEIKRCE